MSEAWAYDGQPFDGMEAQGDAFYLRCAPDQERLTPRQIAAIEHVEGLTGLPVIAIGERLTVNVGTFKDDALRASPPFLVRTAEQAEQLLSWRYRNDPGHVAISLNLLQPGMARPVDGDRVDLDGVTILFYQGQGFDEFVARADEVRRERPGEELLVYGHREMAPTAELMHRLEDDRFADWRVTTSISALWRDCLWLLTRHRGSELIYRDPEPGRPLVEGPPLDLLTYRPLSENASGIPLWELGLMVRLTADELRIPVVARYPNVDPRAELQGLDRPIRVVPDERAQVAVERAYRRDANHLMLYFNRLQAGCLRSAGEDFVQLAIMSVSRHDPPTFTPVIIALYRGAGRSGNAARDATDIDMELAMIDAFAAGEGQQPLIVLYGEGEMAPPQQMVREFYERGAGRYVATTFAELEALTMNEQQRLLHQNAIFDRRRDERIEIRTEACVRVFRCPPGQTELTPLDRAVIERESRDHHDQVLLIVGPQRELAADDPLHTFARVVPSRNEAELGSMVDALANDYHHIARELRGAGLEPLPFNDELHADDAIALEGNVTVCLSWGRPLETLMRRAEELSQNGARAVVIYGYGTNAPDERTWEALLERGVLGIRELDVLPGAVQRVGSAHRKAVTRYQESLASIESLHPTWRQKRQLYLSRIGLRYFFRSHVNADNFEATQDATARFNQHRQHVLGVERPGPGGLMMTPIEEPAPAPKRSQGSHRRGRRAG